MKKVASEQSEAIKGVSKYRRKHAPPSNSEVEHGRTTEPTAQTHSLI